MEQANPITNRGGYLGAYFNQMEPRTKILFFLLIIAVIFSSSFKFFYKPQRAVLSQLKYELDALENKIKVLKAQTPDIASEEKLLEKEKTAFDILKEDLKTMEGQLLSEESIPGLLKELLAQAGAQTIDFKLIKPVKEAKTIEEAGRGAYERFNIELQFSALYSNFADYVHQLEEGYPFVKTKSLIIEEKDMANPNIDITMYLSTILMAGHGEEPRNFPLRSVSAALSMGIKRDPFLSSSFVEIVPKEKKEYVLSGIISQGKQPTAIIDNEVYKVGDRLGNSQIQKITANQVILKDGDETILLTIKEDEQR